jgi:hypothetical protein
MAEYVRRRRPPASHPYWDRLHDRAHPPSLILPIVGPAAVGLFLGIYGGLRPSLTAADAIRFATIVAGLFANVMFVIVVPLLFLESGRQINRQERWSAVIFGAIAISVAAFVASLLPLILMLLWYAACSGEGVWLGMLYGVLIGAVPAAVYAGQRRRRWRVRQQHWPRWERMRLPAAAMGANPTPWASPSAALSADDELGPSDINESSFAGADRSENADKAH